MTHRHRAVPALSRTVCYSGSVAQPEVRAAHGGVCHVDRCACGAERRTNVNGLAIERGPWGPSSAEQERQAREEARALEARRRDAARSERDALLRAALPVEVPGSRGPVRVSIGRDGILDLRGAHLDGEVEALVRASGLLDLATRVRQAHLAAVAS